MKTFISDSGHSAAEDLVPRLLLIAVGSWIALLGIWHRNRKESMTFANWFRCLVPKWPKGSGDGTT